MCVVSKVFGSIDLSGVVMYVSGYLCLMCLLVMYLVGVSEVYYVYLNEDGELYDLLVVCGYVEIVWLLYECEMKLVYYCVCDDGFDLYEVW